MDGGVEPQDGPDPPGSRLACRCSDSGAACRRWSWRTCSTTAARPTTRSCSAPWPCARRTSTPRRRCWRTASWPGGPGGRGASRKVGLRAPGAPPAPPAPPPLQPRPREAPPLPTAAWLRCGPTWNKLHPAPTGLRQPLVPSGPAPVRHHPHDAHLPVPARAGEPDSAVGTPDPASALPWGDLPLLTSTSVGVLDQAPVVACSPLPARLFLYVNPNTSYKTALSVTCVSARWSLP